MRSASIAYLCFIMILASCKTTQQIVPEQSSLQVDAKQKGILRGFLMKESAWISEDPENMTVKIQEVIKEHGESNYNLAVFFANQSTFKTRDQYIENQSPAYSQVPERFDPWQVVIEAAHRNNMRIYAGIDFFNQALMCTMQEGDSLTFNSDFEFSDIELKQITADSKYATRLFELMLSDAEFPRFKTIMKSSVRDFIELYDIDGLQYDLASLLEEFKMAFRNEEFHSNPQRLPMKSEMDSIFHNRIKDLLEDLVVEVMLVKPYLVNSLSFSAGGDSFMPFSCLEDGIVDFISPKINADDKKAFDTFIEYCENKVKGFDFTNGIVPIFNIGSQEDTQIIRQFSNSTDPAISPGYLLNTNFLERLETNAHLLLDEYPGYLEFPMTLKKISSNQVVGLNLSALLSNNISGREVKLLNGKKSKITDSGGAIGVIFPVHDTIDIATSDMSMILNTSRWSVPYRYTLYPDHETVRESPWVEFRRMPSRHTTNPEYHVLYKTEYPAKAYINGKQVKVYKTGIFFDKINLKEGPNRVRASILTPDSLKSFYEEEFFYEKTDKSRSIFPLWIDERTVSLSEDMELLPEDIIPIEFDGSLGQKAFVEIYPAALLIGCHRMDYDDYSRYLANIPARKLLAGDFQQLILRMESSTDTVQNQILDLPLPNRIVIKQLDEFPMVRVVHDNSRMTYNTGPVRLGGPIRAELNPGVILKVDGREGEYYRIRLNEFEKGFIHQENVVVMPPETVRPSYFITSISCSPGEIGDLVSIPYPEPVPYEVYPEPDQKRIVITLFGVKTSSTWITHRQGRRIVDKITWQQTTPETYQIYVNLNTSKIWGYNITVEGRQLVLQVKYPPELERSVEKPFSGLKIAIEAGHGGESTGAEGLSGLLEKDINLDLALKLGKICQDKGAEIVQVRPSDTTMSLLDKREIAISSGTDILISIHANAAGTGRGFLGVPGTSTYYNNPFWAPLAEITYDHLLELGLAEFGVVGSFNYTVIRVTQMPSILVEQAFMTHAEDEEKLSDPHFRQQMATKIFEGILDFLTYMVDDE